MAGRLPGQATGEFYLVREKELKPFERCLRYSRRLKFARSVFSNWPGTRCRSERKRRPGRLEEAGGFLIPFVGLAATFPSCLKIEVSIDSLILAS